MKSAIRLMVLGVVILGFSSTLVWGKSVPQRLPAKSKGKSAVSKRQKMTKKMEAINRVYSIEVVNELKEKVLDAKTQMLLFKHLIKKEGVNSSYPKVSIGFLSEMSSRYEIQSVVYLMDGERIFSYTRNEASAAGAEQKVDEYKGAVAPGEHSLKVQVILRGNETGIFSYLNEYKLTTQGQVGFEVEKNTSTKIEIVAYEKGWILTDFKDRPDLKIKISGANTQTELE